MSFARRIKIPNKQFEEKKTFRTRANLEKQLKPFLIKWSYNAKLYKTIINIFFFKY